MADLRLTEKRIYTLMWMSDNLDESLRKAFVNMGMMETDAQERRFETALGRVKDRLLMHSNARSRDPFKD